VCVWCGRAKEGSVVPAGSRADGHGPARGGDGGAAAQAVLTPGLPWLLRIHSQDDIARSKERRSISILLLGCLPKQRRCLWKSGSLRCVGRLPSAVPFQSLDNQQALSDGGPGVYHPVLDLQRKTERSLQISFDVIQTWSSCFRWNLEGRRSSGVLLLARKAGQGPARTRGRVEASRQGCVRRPSPPPPRTARPPATHPSLSALQPRPSIATPSPKAFVSTSISFPSNPLASMDAPKAKAVKKARPAPPKPKAGEDDLGVSTLPMSRVAKIIKADGEIYACSKEATFLIGIATVSRPH